MFLEKSKEVEVEFTFPEQICQETKQTFSYSLDSSLVDIKDKVNSVVEGDESCKTFLVLQDKSMCDVKDLDEQSSIQQLLQDHDLVSSSDCPIRVIVIQLVSSTAMLRQLCPVKFLYYPIGAADNIKNETVLFLWSADLLDLKVKATSIFTSSYQLKLSMPDELNINCEENQQTLREIVSNWDFEFPLEVKVVEELAHFGQRVRKAATQQTTVSRKPVNDYYKCWENSKNHDPEETIEVEFHNEDRSSVDKYSYESDMTIRELKNRARRVLKLDSEFKLCLQKSDEEQYFFNDSDDSKELKEFSHSNSPLKINIKNSSSCESLSGSNEASGTIVSANYSRNFNVNFNDNKYKPFDSFYDNHYAFDKSSYVGLVNQAMTCYLNSLLQALYMTPEFRNAIYNWEYTPSAEKSETKCIPYQLQKLFLNLQTSPRAAVETTALTKSFGWPSSEAWQQHDIQELCRVMFDALEQKFKNTKQADLINRLYEGKMIDYVKCLECQNENTREDTFLDIPLPIKSFGSNAYSSVEEALQAFVKYETLDGNNQYFCERCGAKHDAQKGLKFKHFPYLLTLHLKRFDFDYNTLHRIKLNDRVTFPFILNLNHFIMTNDVATKEDSTLNLGSDDTSTTDSGNLTDECDPNSLKTASCNSSSAGSSVNHEQEDDEGIEINSLPNNERINPTNELYYYELFAIMIHSGSASGGHYYAYIQDFSNKKWLCFNDQQVYPISQEDIEKSYGGGTGSISAYRSSTNAYMLMYRQIDEKRNTLPMQKEEFPPHIKELLNRMKEEEEELERKRLEESAYHSIPTKDVKVHCYHPAYNKRLVTESISVSGTWTNTDLKNHAYKKFNLDGIVDIQQCRVVDFNYTYNIINHSCTGEEEILFQNLPNIPNDFLLEIREKNEAFKTYFDNAIITKLYLVDVERRDIIDGPKYVRAYESQPVLEFKKSLENYFNIDHKKIVLTSIATGNIISNSSRLFLSPLLKRNSIDKIMISEDTDLDKTTSMHYRIANDLKNVITFYIKMCIVNKEILEKLDIPSLEDQHLLDKSEANDTKKEEFSDGCTSYLYFPNWSNINRSGFANSDCKNDVKGEENILLKKEKCSESDRAIVPEQSNSEDSSLSDSDKTIVGDAPDVDDADLMYLSLDKTNTNNVGLINRDTDDQDHSYIKVDLENPNLLRVSMAYILQDNSVNRLKKRLESYIGVPEKYFSIVSSANCDNVNDRFVSDFSDDETYTIHLERALQSNELKINIHLLQLDSFQMNRQLFTCVIKFDDNFEDVKQKLMKKFANLTDISTNTLLDEYRFLVFDSELSSFATILLDKFMKKIFNCSSDIDLYIQKLECSEQLVGDFGPLVFVGKWNGSESSFDKWQEISVPPKYPDSVDELKEKISERSNIPTENIEFLQNEKYLNLQQKVLGILYSDTRETPRLPVDYVKKDFSYQKRRTMDYGTSTLSKTLTSNSRREKALKINIEST